MAGPVAEAGTEHCEPGFFQHQTLILIETELLKDWCLVDGMNVADSEAVAGFDSKRGDYFSCRKISDNKSWAGTLTSGAQAGI